MSTFYTYRISNVSCFNAMTFIFAYFELGNSKFGFRMKHFSSHKPVFIPHLLKSVVEAMTLHPPHVLKLVTWVRISTPLQKCYLQ